MMHNQFDRLQRSNLALADERDELKRVVALHEQTIRELLDKGNAFAAEMQDMIATLEQESRQMRARNERLEKELAEALAIINRYSRPDCGGAHHAEQAEQEPCIECGRPTMSAESKCNDCHSMDDAAPVRTKDLTDDEIDQVRDKTWCFSNSLREFARAVIAADREKNRAS